MNFLERVAGVMNGTGPVNAALHQALIGGQQSPAVSPQMNSAARSGMPTPTPGPSFAAPAAQSLIGRAMQPWSPPQAAQDPMALALQGDTPVPWHTLPQWSLLPAARHLAQYGN